MAKKSEVNMIKHVNSLKPTIENLLENKKFKSTSKVTNKVKPSTMVEYVDKELEEFKEKVNKELEQLNANITVLTTANNRVVDNQAEHLHVLSQRIVNVSEGAKACLGSTDKYVSSVKADFQEFKRSTNLYLVTLAVVTVMALGFAIFK